MGCKCSFDYAVNTYFELALIKTCAKYDIQWFLTGNLQSDRNAHLKRHLKALQTQLLEVYRANGTQTKSRYDLENVLLFRADIDLNCKIRN